MGNTELLKNIVPLEEKNKGKNEYLYSLCFSKPINGIFVRRDIILSQQGHEIYTIDFCVEVRTHFTGCNLRIERMFPVKHEY